MTTPQSSYSVPPSAPFYFTGQSSPASTQQAQTPPPTEEEELTVIKTTLSWLPQFWQVACEMTPRKVVEDIVDRDPEELASHSWYGPQAQQGVKFYTIKRMTTLEEVLWVMEEAQDRELDNGVTGKEAVLTRNTCKMSCFVLKHVLERFFEGSRYIQSIQWGNFLPRPVFVLFEAEPEISPNTGEESVYSHDALILTTFSGHEFVVDATGAQFGIKEHFIPIEEYMRNHVYEFNEFVYPSDTDCPLQVLKDLAVGTIKSWESRWRINCNNILNLEEYMRNNRFRFLLDDWRAALKKNTVVPKDLVSEALEIWDREDKRKQERNEG